MAQVEMIQCEGDNTTFIWKHPMADLCPRSISARIAIPSCQQARNSALAAGAKIENSQEDEVVCPKCGQKNAEGEILHAVRRFKISVPTAAGSAGRREVPP